MIDSDIEIGIGSAEQVLWQDSYLLGIRFDENPRLMTLHLELALARDHPLYSDPLPNEARCYARARIEFSDYRILNESAPQFRVSIEPDGAGDLGGLYSIRQKHGGLFSVEGEFGDLEVRASSAALTFERQVVI